MKLFVDTWGWLTLRDRKELRHRETVDFYHDFRAQGGQLYTTDYVLDETLTIQFKRLPFPQAWEALQLLEEAIQTGSLKLEWITPDRFQRTKALRLNLQDKPLISFTDLSSMVVMQELDISLILTGDAHFTHVGFEFQNVP